MIRSIGLIMTLALVCMGCKNPYSDFYQSRQQVIGNTNFEQPQGEPNIYNYSADTEKDNRVMRENGFSLVGYSSFTGGGSGVTKENLIAQAKKVGASVVMVKTDDAGTVTGVMPYTTTSPGQVITSNSYGTANAYGTGGSAYGSYQGSTSTYVPGTTSTQMIPYTVQRYDFLASYWAKIRPRIFGGVYSNLPPEVSQRLQRNTGVVVDLVMRGTPAFFANILVGDVIIKVDDEEVSDERGFTEILIHCPKQVTMTIIRGNQEKSISLSLNKTR
jgi:hypothetical protein